MGTPSHFSYQSTRDDRVMIFADGKLAKTLKGKDAVRFLNRIAGATDADGQRLMAVTTGQFKFGNERRGDRPDGQP